MNMHLNIITITHNIFSKIIKKLNISGIEGELGIYPGHTHLITVIKPGLLHIIKTNEIEKHLYISGGILEIKPFNITILADTILCGENLNKQNILNKKKEIEKKIKIYTNNNKMINNLKKEMLQIHGKLRVINNIDKSRLK